MKKKLDLEDILIDSLETDYLEIPLKNKILKGLLFVFLFLIIVFLIQIFNLIVVKKDYYQKRALANMYLEKVKIAPRGLIKDRFGKNLLENVSISNAYLNFSFLKKEDKEKEEFLKKISQILNLNYNQLYQEIKKYNWLENPDFLLKTDISQEELINLISLNLKEIKIEESFKRKYLDNFAFSHVLGYVGFVEKKDLENNPDLFFKDLIGKNGLELYYDNYLRGRNGKEIYLKDALGKNLEKIEDIPFKAGNDLKTFIDSEMQLFLYNKLKENLQRIDSEKGLVLVTNPQNGEVLSLISYPSYDLEKVYLYLNKENNPIFNRVVSGVYSPGSTIKPLIGVAALEEKIVDPLKSFYSAGYLLVNNPYNPKSPFKFLDWKKHGWVNLYSALARSSNIYFYAVGGGLLKESNLGEQVGLGVARLKKWFEIFNLNQKTEIDLPFENVGFIPDPIWKQKQKNAPWYLGDTYNISIGQGDLMLTPVSLLNYINAIANGGKFFKLRLASEEKILKDLSFELNDSINEVKKGMLDAVLKDYGTAHLLSDIPLKIAAKTGSAQILNNLKTNALFVGFAPYDNPQVSILILVEDSKEGSLNTLPLARDFFWWYYLNRFNK